MISDPLIVRQYGGIEAYREKFYENSITIQGPNRAFGYRFIRALSISYPFKVIAENSANIGSTKILISGLLLGFFIDRSADMLDSYIPEQNSCDNVVENL